MKQTLTIRRRPTGVREAVRIRKVHLGQRIFKKLFGHANQVAILVPGDDVSSIEIKEEEINHDETVALDE